MYCEVSGLSIHYAEVGRGRPFVFLHGSPSYHRWAMGQIEPSFRGRRGWSRIYPDLPGHGGSPGSPRVHNIDQYLRVLRDFVDEVSSRGRLVLGGNSFGAYLALGLARTLGPRLDGLLLSVPQIHFGPGEEALARRSPALRPGRTLKDVLADKSYHEDTAFLQGLAYRDFSFDLYGPPRTFGAPALFLFGRQDSPTRYRKYWSILDAFPRATFAVLDEAGHGLWWDRPSLAQALVRDWLDRIEGGEPGAKTRGRRRPAP